MSVPKQPQIPGEVSQNLFPNLWKQSLPHLDSGLDKFICRALTAVGARKTIGIRGNLENLNPKYDPMVVAFNHSQRNEAILIPAMFTILRDGSMLHFMADWNFAMIPGVGLLYRRGGVIVVAYKNAKPRFLNVFRKYFRSEIEPFDQAVEKLKSGRSIGVFPEGTVNRDPLNLMRGRPGAAKMALMSGARILPVGIEFPQQDPKLPIKDGSPMILNIGEHITPPAPAQTNRPSQEETKALHAAIMMAISRLCGKSWDPKANKRRKNVV